MATKEEIKKQIEALNEKQRSIELEIRGEPRRQTGLRPRESPRGATSIRDRLGPRRNLGTRDIRTRRVDDRASPRISPRLFQAGLRTSALASSPRGTPTRKRRLMSSVVVADDKDTAEGDDKKDEASEDVSPFKKKVKTRDKRLFGNLMAHLGRARRDLKKNQAKVENRRKVEVEVLRKQDENRQKLRMLHVKINREKKDELRQRKKDVMKQKDALRIKLLAFSWRAHDELLGNFLQTSTQPAIFFVPARHTDKTRAMLAARKETVAAEVKAKAEKSAEEENKAQDAEDEGGDGNDDGDEGDGDGDGDDDDKDSDDDSDDED